MKKNLKILAFAAIFALSCYALFAGRSHAFIDKGTYTYIHNEAEYSMDLPDAPTGETIWADRKEPVPYLEDPPKFGPLGEHAWITRADLDTGDLFNLDVQLDLGGGHVLDERFSSVSVSTAAGERYVGNVLKSGS